MTTDDTPKKPGRGGKRPGAGRPAVPPGKKYTVYFPAATVASLERAAEAGGVSPHAWITRLVKENLEVKS